jgi:hypothetical protein
MVIANQEYKEALTQAGKFNFTPARQDVGARVGKTELISSESLLEEMQNALAVALDDTHDPQLEETAKQLLKKGVGDVVREEEVEKPAI